MDSSSNKPDSEDERQDAGAPITSARRLSLIPSPVKLSKSILTLLAKPKEDFLRELYSFMESISQPIAKMPSLGYQELDLHRLFGSVISRGGMDEVTRRQEWKLVYQDLEIPTMSTSASYNTRTNYKKYLYLFELEVCDWGEEKPVDAPGPRFQVGDYVRIESSTFNGQVYYAQINKYRYRNNANMYYVHYNGWSTSHDEWMPELVLDELRPEEVEIASDLPNPSPTRSSKSNYIIYDPLVSERHHNPARPFIPTGGLASAPGSSNLTPKQQKVLNRKRSSPGKSSADEYDQEEEFIISRMAFASAQASPDLLTAPNSSPYGHIYQQHVSPASSSRQTARNRSADKRDTGRGLFLEEMEHPAIDDKVHGYPKRNRTSFGGLDFGLGMPEQLYYFGGQWKHSTPRVRKFHLHRAVLGNAKISSSIDDKLLAKMMKPAKTVIPSIPKLTVPKLPPVKASLSATVMTLDKRSIKQIEADIASKETRLKEMKKDLKHKTKLLHKYYGNKAKPNTASALLSSAMKVTRR